MSSLKFSTETAFRTQSFIYQGLPTLGPGVVIWAKMAIKKNEKNIQSYIFWKLDKISESMQK